MNKVLPKKRLRISERALTVLSGLLFLLWALGRICERIISDTELFSFLFERMTGIAFLFQWAGALWYVPGAYLISCIAKQRGFFYKVILWSLVVALCAEIPYYLIFSKRGNFIFAFFFSAAALYFCSSNFAGWKGRIVKLSAVAAAVTWSFIMSVEGGAVFVILCTLIWALRRKMMLVSALSAVFLSVVSVFDPLMMLAPMGAVILYFCKDVFDE